eukprot:7180756-Pyramimonas_sp.AAC.2
MLSASGAVVDPWFASAHKPAHSAIQNRLADAPPQAGAEMFVPGPASNSGAVGRAPGVVDLPGVRAGPLGHADQRDPIDPHMPGNAPTSRRLSIASSHPETYARQWPSA